MNKIKAAILQESSQVFDKMSEDLKNFSGDPALFWAGRMSHYVCKLQNASLEDFSEIIHILGWIQEEYESIIIQRTDQTSQDFPIPSQDSGQII